MLLIVASGLMQGTGQSLFWFIGLMFFFCMFNLVTSLIFLNNWQFRVTNLFILLRKCPIGQIKCLTYIVSYTFWVLRLLYCTATWQKGKSRVVSCPHDRNPRREKDTLKYNIPSFIYAFGLLRPLLQTEYIHCAYSNFPAKWPPFELFEWQWYSPRWLQAMLQ